MGCPSFGGQRTVFALSPLCKSKHGVVRRRARRAHSRPCNWSVLQPSVRPRIKRRRRICVANANLTIRSSGQPPEYRGLPLTSNVGQNTMPEMHISRGARVQRLLGACHLSPCERAVRPAAAMRTICGLRLNASHKGFRAHATAAVHLLVQAQRWLPARQPSPPEWAVRPTAAKRAARGLRLNASRRGFHAPVATAACLLFQGQLRWRVTVWAASGSCFAPPRTPNPSFERTFPGVPAHAAQLKRWAPAARQARLVPHGGSDHELHS